MCSLRLDTMCVQSFRDANCSHIGFSEPTYPSRLHALAAYINQPKFLLVFMQFLYKCCHPEEQLICSTNNWGMPCLWRCNQGSSFRCRNVLCAKWSVWVRWLMAWAIHSTPNFFGHPRYDTVFVVTDDSWLGIEGMEIGCVLLFFSFEYWHKNFLCVLINWFVHTDGHDLDTWMWIMRQEVNHCGEPILKVIHLDSIAQAAHLLPVYGQSHILEDFDHHTVLDTYNSFFVNHYINHHAHEFIGMN